MLLKSLLTILSLSLFVVAAWSHANSTVNAINPIKAFNLTAISAVNGASVLECWQITLPLTISQTPGTEGAAIQQLGNLSSMVWSSVPGGYAGSPHPAPSVQYNAILSGILRVTIPNSPQQATVYGGKYGLIIAVDTANVSKIGHVSSTIGKEELTALMIPTENGKIPPHKVIHRGACEKHDLEL